jgi:UDP-glucose 4-epimerase
MNVLVTGASGHVGGAIATHLVQKGWNVVGLSRTPSSVKGLSHSLQADMSSLSFPDQMMTQLPVCQAIVHAAASLDKEPYAHTIAFTNCFGTQQILKLSEMWEVKRFVYLSGVSVIGVPKHLPITEDHPTDPLTAYHASKLFGEYLTAIARRRGLVATILRLTSPIGPGMSAHRIFSMFIQRAIQNVPLVVLGQGTRQQNYVDVRDVSVAVEHCLQQEVQGCFNIAGSHSIANIELAQACINLLDSSSPILFAEQQDPEEGVIWDVSIAKAQQSWGYTPQYSLEESIRTVAKEYAHSDY